jgi:hypothetical protein
MHIRHILSAAIVWAAVLCAVPAGLACAESRQFIFTVETPDLQTLTLRAVVRYQVVTAFCVYKQDELSSFGFSTPFSVLGSVINTGLLREIRNPLAYSASSGVFREKSDIRLTTSLDGGAYWGLAFRPLPGSLMFYYYGKKNEPFSAGALARLEWDKTVRLELLVNTSCPRTPEPSADWFTDRAPFAGGRLVHAAGRLSLGHSPLYAIVSGALSCGELSEPGYFFHTICGLNTRPLDLSLIFGYGDKHYFDPEARGTNKNIMYGGDFAWKTLDWLEFSGRYRRTIEHGHLGQGKKRNSSEELGSGVEVTVGVGTGITFYGETAYTARFYYPEEAGDYMTHTLNTTVTCDTDGRSLSAIFCLKNIGSDDQSMTLGLELELKNNVTELVVGVNRIQQGESARYNCRAAFFIILPHQKYYLKLNTKGELDPDKIDWRTFTDEFTRRFCVTLGWEGSW